MEKFRWGKIKENPNVYIDENIMRMTQNLVSNFAKLAEELVRKGENDKAVKVVDKCLEELPLSKINVNYFHSTLPDIYIKAGQKDKAKALAEQIVAVCDDEMKYLLKVYAKEKKNYSPGSFGKQREVSEYLYLLQQLSRVYQIEDPEYSKLLGEKLTNYSNQFQQ